MSGLLSADQLEAALRAIGGERYHDKHPFHRLLHDGRLTRAQVQAWALNRYYYQSRIPMKDAALIARCDDPALRLEWRRRLADHDGREGEAGGIERWLALTDALGLDRAAVASTRLVLPGVRFAVDAYVRFVAEQSLLEAIASSLTELFSPQIISERVAGMLHGYDFVPREALAYFERRLDQAPRDSDFALRWVLREAATEERQQAALEALRFKCAVLWTQLDCLHFAYVEPGIVPPGAWRP